MHVPVLAEAAIELLSVRPEGVYVDCTVGAGGHAERVAQRLTTGRLIGLDRDATALALARERLAGYAGVELVHRNYRELAEVLAGRGVDAVDGVLIDAGVSSMQLDAAERGFSFQETGPLDMRMDPSQTLTAARWLAQASRDELVETLKTLGDVRPAGRVADAIVARREAGRMATTGDLAEAVREALPFVKGMPEEVRTVFQAVRMAVNEELGGLREGVEQAAKALRPGGRMVVIAFHSGEDRVVKRFIREASRPRRELLPDGRVARVTPPMLRDLTGKPVRPDAAETAANPRAASARLRAAERLPGEAESDG